MERTPPATKTKGDLLLELRDIRLLINQESSKLEKIQRDIVQANTSFTERDKKLTERESNCARIEKLFNDAGGSTEKYIINLNKTVDTIKENIQKLTKREEKLKNDIKNREEKDKKESKELSEAINSKKKTNETLDRQFKSINEMIKEKTNILKEVESKIKQNELDAKQRESALFEREQKVEKAEKRLEQTKTDMRIWLGRLHERYDKFMNPVEAQLTDFKIE